MDEYTLVIHAYSLPALGIEKAYPQRLLDRTGSLGGRQLRHRASPRVRAGSLAESFCKLSHRCHRPYKARRKACPHVGDPLSSHGSPLGCRSGRDHRDSHRFCVRTCEWNTVVALLCVARGTRRLLPPSPRFSDRRRNLPGRREGGHRPLAQQWYPDELRFRPVRDTSNIWRFGQSARLPNLTLAEFYSRWDSRPVGTWLPLSIDAMAATTESTTPM